MARYTMTMNEFIQSELQRRGHNEFYNAGRLTFNRDHYAFIQKIIKYDHDISCIVDECIFKGFKLKDKDVDLKFKKSFITHFLDREIGRQTIEGFVSQVLYVTLTHEDYIYYTFSNLFDNYLQGMTTSIFEDVGNTQQEGNRNVLANSDDHGKSHSETNTNVKGNSETDTTDSKTSINDTRSANATLPQSEVNINVENTELNYADTNDISKNKSTDKSTGNSVTNDTQNTVSTTDGTTENINVSKSDENTKDNQDTLFNHDGTNRNFNIELLQKAFDMKERIFNEYDKKCFLHIW